MVTQDQAKEAAAQAAASLVLDGMIVGLGTGTTAKFAVDALAQRMRDGLRFTAVPTSEATAQQARSLGIPLVDLDRPIDLTIDGADEIDPKTLNLIKGRGGALLREKLVAAASKQLIIVADNSKLVEHLGSKMPVPVEVIPFGWRSTAQRLEALGCTAVLRQGFTTDGGHSILDCAFGVIADPESLAHQIDAITGVVEHGLFLNLATQAVVAGVGQPLWLRRPPRPPRRDV
ncbi:MAG: ribose-5-phosphate isomerase RpiA [Bryobacteraceae bacterium]